MSDIDQLIKAFHKQYKNEKIVTLGVHDDDPPRIHTGFFAFDLATGGGIPIGRCSIIYGPEASAKTTLCLKLIASAQKLYPDKKAVFIDVEGHFSRPWATKMGVDCDSLVYVIPDNAEQTVDIVESLLYATDASLIVLDSLAALVTVAELDSAAEKAVVGNTGIVVNKLYRKVGRALSLARREDHKPTLVCINQIRSKIGVMYGNPETMPGGHAFKFASSMTIRVYGKDQVVKEVDESLPAYKEVKFIVKKHKVPIVAPNGVFLMALQSISKPPLSIGQSYDWNTVTQYLKTYNLLLKNDGGGWDLFNPKEGELVSSFKTQKELRDKMEQDSSFNDQVKQFIIEVVLDEESVPGEE